MAYPPVPVPYYGPNFSSGFGNYQSNLSTPQIAYPNTQPVLNLVPGRMVKDESEIMASDVPMDGVSIFPMSDGSKIFMKQWDGKGGITTTTYVPQTETSNQSEEATPAITMDDLFNLLTNIDNNVKSFTNKNNHRNNNKQNKQYNQNGSSEMNSKEDKDV